MAGQFFFLQSPPPPQPPPPLLPSFPSNPYLIPPPISQLVAAAMNATAIGSEGAAFGSGKMSGIGYGIGVSIGILIVIMTITLAFYYWTRPHPPPVAHRLAVAYAASGEQPLPDIEAGLDEDTLLSYPTLLYSEAKLQKKDTTASCCSICLADYKDTDVLRLLPDCGHLFHLKCVDAWLLLHPTCPICRTSPLPTPLTTPLADVVPLASARV